MDLSKILKSCRRTTLAVAALFVVTASSANSDQMTEELQRFIKVYRAAEAQDLSLKITFQTARNEGRASKEVVDCLVSKLTPTAFNDALMDIARKNFQSLQNLKELNNFLESTAGRKVTDQALNWYKSSFERLVAGLAPLPIKPSSYTAKEWNEIQAIEKRPAHADFKRFTEVGLRDLPSNELFKQRMSEIKSQCIQ